MHVDLQLALHETKTFLIFTDVDDFHENIRKNLDSNPMEMETTKKSHCMINTFRKKFTTQSNSEHFTENKKFTIFSQKYQEIL